MAISQSLVLGAWLLAAWACVNGQRRTTNDALQFFNGYTIIRIDAHLARDLHRFFRDLPRAELRVQRQSLGRRLRIRTAAADSRDLAIGLYHVPLPAQQKRRFLVANQQQRFQMTQKFIGPPIFRQLHGGAPQVAVILLELSLEAAEKRERVGGRPGKSRQNLVVVEAANLLRGVLDHRFAKRNLAIP